jgi:hypothetical protein
MGQSEHWSMLSITAGISNAKHHKLRIIIIIEMILIKSLSWIFGGSVISGLCSKDLI